MKKLMISLAVVSALSLSACDDETIADIEKENAQQESATSLTQVRFDPAGGDISIPNDILFSDTTDGTLNIPDIDSSDYGDPKAALSALDGWSTNQPFAINLVLGDGVSLDQSSLLVPGAIAIHQVTMGGSLTDADCNPVPQGIACKGEEELMFGVDYVVKSTGAAIAVIPLKPLKAQTTYIVTLTNQIMDSEGRSVVASASYDLVRKDINESPIQNESLYKLQALVNSYEAVVEGFGVDKDSIIYTMAMTTQSIDDSLQVTKKLLAASLDPTTAMFATPMVSGVVANEKFPTATAMLNDLAEKEEDKIPADLVPLYNSALLYSGSITVPSYSGKNATGALGESTFWTAMCDSGATLAGLAAKIPSAIPTEAKSPADGACMALSGGALRETSNWDLTAYDIETPIDAERNITKFNSIPQIKGSDTLDVQITVPDLNWANLVRPQLGLEGELVKPPGGWPVVILQHGITSKKEDVLALTGLLSINGFATVAIDHPLHNSRGIDLTGDNVPDFEASSNPLAYMNIANLLNARDNLKQSTTDLMALRLGINFMGGDLTGNVFNPDPELNDINPTRVHFVGHSLGAMTGVNFLALTNDSLGLGDTVDSLFSVQASSLASAAGGIPNFLFESVSFSGVIKANLAFGASDEFKEFAIGTLGEAAADPLQLTSIWPDFIAGLSDAQLASVNGIFKDYVFAAQTILDSADMVNYAGQLAENGTPLHMIEMAGGGFDADGNAVPADLVIPLTTASAPLSGSTPLQGLLGVNQVSESTYGENGTISGGVKFLKGGHGSLLSPGDDAATTQEIQTQVATYLFTNGAAIVITDETLVE